MIDNTDFELDGFDSPIPGARLSQLVDQETGEILETLTKRKSVSGDYPHAKAQIHASTNKKKLFVQGSLCNVLTGQNVHGPNNLLGLLLRFLPILEKSLGRPLPLEARSNYLAGNIELTRVDIAFNIHFGDEKRAISAIRLIRRKCGCLSARVIATGTWVCFSPRDGKEFDISIYAKASAVRYQRLQDRADFGSALLLHCGPFVRFEVTLRKSELIKLKLNRANLWTPEIAERIFFEYLAKFPGFGVYHRGLSKKEEAELPKRLRPVYALWKHGIDLTTCYEPRSLRRLRLEFERLGIDLAQSPGVVAKDWINLEYLQSRIVRLPTKELLQAGLRLPPIPQDDPLLAKDPPKKPEALRGGRLVEEELAGPVESSAPGNLSVSGKRKTSATNEVFDWRGFLV
jgi:hypothetical protein